MTDPEDGDLSYLRAIGDRVRALRARRGMTRRILARDSGVSERYLAKLEAGQGNASLLVIRALAAAFGIGPEALVAETEPSPETAGLAAMLQALRPDQLAAAQRFLAATLAGETSEHRNRRIALIGLRGAGKSTVGAALAEQLAIPFIELDREVEREAGVPLATIFEFYGQAGFRRHERRCLERLLETEPAFVLATGGSIVSEPMTFERLLASCFTVWLRASPAEHMERVVAQGDLRPMAGNREAMQDLRRILAGRERLYRRADAEITTSGRSVAESVAAVSAALPQDAL